MPSTSRDELQELQNLGKTSAQWLHACGIHSIPEIRRLGAVQAYACVRQRAFRVTRSLLYALDAALRDLPSRQLDEQRKAELDRLYHISQEHNARQLTP